MTNSEGITKAECRALVAIRNQAWVRGSHWRWNLVIGASLELGGWDLGFPQSAVARQKTSALEKTQRVAKMSRTIRNPKPF
jgi:hypothetical protein